MLGFGSRVMLCGALGAVLVVAGPTGSAAQPAQEDLAPGKVQVLGIYPEKPRKDGEKVHPYHLVGKGKPFKLRLGGPAAQPAHESLWAKPYRQLMLVANTAMWNSLARKRVRALIGSAMFFDRAACELQMTRIVLALQLHLARTGEAPEKLDAVAAELGGELPPDPYSGKDFVYRRRGGGWVLYSVGENYVDDGGRVGPEAEQFILDVVYQFSPAERVSGRQRPTTTDSRGETHPLPSEPLR